MSTTEGGLCARSIFTAYSHAPSVQACLRYGAPGCSSALHHCGVGCADEGARDGCMLVQRCATSATSRATLHGTAPARRWVTAVCLRCGREDCPAAYAGDYVRSGPLSSAAEV